MNPRVARARSLPLVVAGLLVLGVVAIGAITQAIADDSNDAPTDAVVSASPSVATIPASTTSTTPVVDTTIATSTTLPQFERTLALGSSGDDVRTLQRRLTELGFVPGGDDGYFGPLTVQAVWTFEKLVLRTPNDEITGQITSDDWDQLMDPLTRVEPRRSEPGTTNHTEIYLPEQAMAVFHDGQAVFVAHMSHGTGKEWCEEVKISPGEYGNEDGTEPLLVGRCGVSNTPGGVFEYHRMVDGRRDSALGGMLNPVYFNYGIAVHGASNVPNEPASHGCVRIPNEISAIYQSLVDIGERVFVWDGLQEPEHYGDQPPTFDRAWDDYVPSTTTTTTIPTTITTTTTATATIPTNAARSDTVTSTEVDAPFEMDP